MPTTPQPLSPATAEFGRRVRARRHELGLSQEALATAAELHWTFVGQVERGKRNLTLHNVLKLASALHLDAGELMRGITLAGSPPEAEAASKEPGGTPPATSDQR